MELVEHTMFSHPSDDTPQCVETHPPTGFSFCGESYEPVNDENKHAPAVSPHLRGSCGLFI